MTNQEAKEAGRGQGFSDADDRISDEQRALKTEDALDESSIAATNPRRSACVDIAGAVDVDVTVTIGGRPIAGEVTLAPRQYDGTLAAYGPAPDHWISGALLSALRQLGDVEFRAACDELEATARDTAASGVR